MTSLRHELKARIFSSAGKINAGAYRDRPVNDLQRMRLSVGELGPDCSKRVTSWLTVSSPSWVKLTGYIC